MVTVFNLLYYGHIAVLGTKKMHLLSSKAHFFPGGLSITSEDRSLKGTVSGKMESSWVVNCREWILFT